MAKVVLVSHLERNKKISIPLHKSEGDIEYLRREFLKHFFFEKNVKLQITFQHFDPEWEEYVDLEEDAVVHHKDKLKAIVTPRLSDSAPTTSASVTDEGGLTELEQSLVRDDDFSESMEGDEGLGSEIHQLNSLPKSSVVDSDDETLHVPKRKRLRVLEDDLVCSA